MSDHALSQTDPFDVTSLRGQQLAPRMVAWNTALTAIWAYLTFGEFVITREFPEFIAIGFALLVPLLVLQVSARLYRDYLGEPSRGQWVGLALRALVTFVLLLLLATILGMGFPEPLGPPLLFVVFGGILAYRVRVKQRWFKTLAPIPMGQFMAFWGSIVLGTLASLVSTFSG